MATGIPDKETVNTQLENRINYLLRLYGSKEKVEQVTGKTIDQLREEYRTVVVDQMMAEHLQK